MCGIAGLLGVDPELASDAPARMLAAMRHRGPDDEGTFVGPRGDGAHSPILVHTRLAIVDLSSDGHQPMSDRSRGDGPANHVVFNGEIFNHRELRPALERAGWPCRTRSDTEVILNAYRVWGQAAVDRMRGMFAWCLLDGERRTAWLCRDRLGVKPLYLFRPRTGGLLFASEIRALLAAGPDLVPPNVDARALESYFAQGAVFGATSIIEGVSSLGPGEELVTDWSGKPLARRTYWDILGLRASESRSARRGERARAVEDLRRVLRESVAMRLVADVPVGLFLSGGVDSGALATIATEMSASSVETICVGFDRPEFDESAGAGAVARQLGTRHHLVHLTGTDVLRDIPSVLAAMEQPTVDGFNTFFVSRAARRTGLTVALSGLGGDELFGGYASFRDVPRALALRRRLGSIPILRGVLGRTLRALGSRASAKTAEALARPPRLLDMYLLRRELFLPAERRALHGLPEGCDPYSGIGLEILSQPQPRASDPSGVANEISRLELTMYMRNMLLRDADTFSMASGLELRVPFLDHRLVEAVLPLPGAWKRRDPRPKPLLIDAAGPGLPASCYRGPKRGFAFPWNAWLRGAMRDAAASAVSAGRGWRDIGVHPQTPARMWARFLARDPRVSALQILALVVLADYAGRHRLRAR